MNQLPPGAEIITIVKSKHFKKEDEKYFKFTHKYAELEQASNKSVERLLFRMDIIIN